MHVCEGQRLISCVFITSFSTLFLRQGVSTNLEFTYIRGDACLCLLPSDGSVVCAATLCFYRRAGDLNLGSHARVPSILFTFL